MIFKAFLKRKKTGMKALSYVVRAILAFFVSMPALSASWSHGTVTVVESLPADITIRWTGPVTRRTVNMGAL